MPDTQRRAAAGRPAGPEPGREAVPPGAGAGGASTAGTSTTEASTYQAGARVEPTGTTPPRGVSEAMAEGRFGQAERPPQVPIAKEPRGVERPVRDKEPEKGGRGP